MKKGYYSLIAIILALFLVSQNHLKQSFGDSIFTAIGWSPWTNKENTGLHLPVLISVILLIIGFFGAVRYFRSRYPQILSRLVIGCIAFFLVFPFITEGVMFLVKYNSNEIDSVDISNGKCSFLSEENIVTADCSFTLFNYGELDKIAIKPILPTYLNDVAIEFERIVVPLDKHRRMNFGLPFKGTQRNGSGFTGFVQDVGFEVVEH